MSATTPWSTASRARTSRARCATWARSFRRTGWRARSTTAAQERVSERWIRETLDRVDRPGPRESDTSAHPRPPDRAGALPANMFERLVERVCASVGCRRLSASSRCTNVAGAGSPASISPGRTPCLPSRRRASGGTALRAGPGVTRSATCGSSGTDGRSSTRPGRRPRQPAEFVRMFEAMYLHRVEGHIA